MKPRYLGLEFNWKGRLHPKNMGKLQSMLQVVIAALLKPYQRLELLNSFIIPRLTHELVLGTDHRNTLVKMDQLIRFSVRRWLRLPRDTPMAYFHSRLPDGGLGIPCMSTSIALAQKARFEKPLSSKDRNMKGLIQQESFKKMERQINLPWCPLV